MRFVRFDVAGDDFDEIAAAVGELRRQTKLPDQDDLVAIKIDRQDGDRRSGAQQVARFDASVRATRLDALVGTKSAPENLAPLDLHLRGLIGDLVVHWSVGSRHSDVWYVRGRQTRCAPSPHLGRGWMGVTGGTYGS